ncbi:uncharacterized protein EMH_0069680 [Eimeria mitis]|uniref:PDZ domain-containing protein n=1 Tax=Eimeria mitis TaxID=44415 RepID=U6KHH8_9EIME|nr:uncharacterized protein EMH_0069680 [Eimeria mitis]CDJ36251.1 hypothetical protein, conserved [Eimeria mitis]
MHHAEPAFQVVYPNYDRERWVTAAVTTAFFLSSSPAVFRSGAPALCRELSRQRVERELQQSPEPLKLQQVFRKIEPLVVQVYAVLQTQAPFAHKALGQTEFDEEQHAHEQYHFLGSGFFFDDEATDVAVLRVNNSFQGKECPHVHGKFAVTRPEMGEIIATYAATEHANEPIGVAGQVLQPRQTFRPTDDSGNLGLLQLQLLTLPGMSGAPVVDMEGSIVGMLVKKFDICGLALPSAVVLRVAESLRDSGKFTVPSIGLLVTEEMPRLAAARPNLPTGSGLKVCRVTPGSAADRAGVREGDLIINVKGEVMDSIGRNEDKSNNSIMCFIRI